MTAWRGLTWGAVAFGMLVTLAACVTQRPTAPAATSPEATPPAASPEPEPRPAEASSALPPTSSSALPQNATTAAEAPPTSTTPCSCKEAKAKPKPKPKRKPVLKAAPPQLPTAPVVENTPPGGLIDAQVRSMSVSVMSILGKRVRGANGEDLGRVVDVLADASGRVRTAIIDFGGFLGVGNHRVAVDWPLLRFNPDGSDPSLLLSLSADKLRTAPEYKENPRPQILMVPSVSTAAPAD